MTQAEQKRLIAAMMKQTGILLNTHEQEIFEAYDAALAQHAEDDDDAKRKFNFRIGVGFKLSGATEGQYDLDGKIRFSVVTVRDIHDTVRTTPDLVDQMEKSAAGELEDAEAEMDFDLDEGMEAAEPAPEPPRKPRGRPRGSGARAGN